MFPEIQLSPIRSLLIDLVKPNRTFFVRLQKEPIDSTNTEYL